MNIYDKESQGCLIDFIEITISSPMAIITQTCKKTNMVMKYIKFDKILQIPPPTKKKAKQQEMKHHLVFVDCLHTFM